ncbi:MBL fold metallo-hydrolase [Candidatus Woesearchaeota archaeon]|nr:MBL fold metallo-hydrolase [Candidatus Woesearchaeota archaeon]
MKLAEDIYYFKGTRFNSHRGSSSNVYVIGDKQTNIIIDCGLYSYAASLKKKLLKNSISLKNNVVTFTHTHPDHVTGATIFNDKSNKFVCSRLQKDELEKPEEVYLNYIKNIKSGPYSSFAKRKTIRNILKYFFIRLYGEEGTLKIEEIINENTLLKNKLLVLYTPGHTLNSVAFYYEKHKALFCGDTINTLTRGYPTLNCPDSDINKYIYTLENLKTLDVELLCPGHNGIIFGKERIHGELQKNIDKCLELKRTTLNYLGNKDQSLRQLKKKVLSPFPKEFFFTTKTMMMYTILKGLIKDKKVKEIHKKVRTVYRAI